MAPEINLTATWEQQIGIAKPEIERCGTHMLKPSSSSEQSMADDDDDEKYDSKLSRLTQFVGHITY